MLERQDKLDVPATIALSGGRLHHFVPDDIEDFVFEKLNQSPRKG